MKEDVFIVKVEKGLATKNQIKEALMDKISLREGEISIEDGKE